MLDRVPPHDREAERALLGSIMQDASMIDGVAAIVQPADFYVPSHVTIAKTIMALYDKGGAVDFVTVLDALKERGAEETGGGEYLAELADSVPSAANADQYAAIVKEKAVRRRGIVAASGLVVNLYDPTRDSLEQISKAADKLQRLEAEGATDEPVLIGDAVKAVFDDLAKGDTEGLSGVRIPWRPIHKYITNILPGWLVILAGRTSTGKTSAALQLALAAARDGHPTAIFSLEMTRKEIAMRLLCAVSGVGKYNLHPRANIAEGTKRKILDAAKELQRLPIHIEDHACTRIEQIAAASRQLKRQAGIKLVIVDYLQLLDLPTGPGSTADKISAVTRASKRMAMQLELPVVMLSQLNRQADEGGRGTEIVYRRPRLSDLRGSGSIEQDANCVIFTHRERPFSTETTERTAAELIVAKQRDGAIGIAPAVFDEIRLQFHVGGGEQ